MDEVDKLSVEGSSPVAQNGHLAGYIGDKPYRIERIVREPPSGPGVADKDQKWVVYGSW
ncbi:MAG: hypothetical protein ABFE13_13620 [Phycisphaerales bacterium]